MRVLFLATDFRPNPGGIAELTHQVARELATRGYEVTVATESNANEWGQAAVPYALKSVDLSPSGNLGQRLLRRYRVLKSLVITNRPTIIINNQYDRLTFSLMLIVRALGVPFCLYTHGLDINRRTRLLTRVKRSLSLRLSAIVVCNSDYTRRLAIRRGASSSRAVVVHPGVDPTHAYCPALPNVTARSRRDVFTDGRPVLLTVSRLVERKGVDMVLAALPFLREGFPSVLYLVAGEGDHKEALERKAMAMGLREHVRFVGWVSDAEKHTLYDKCDLFVLPNRESGDGHVEGFGIVFLEAALHGKPVIAGNSGGTVDAVLDGVTGLLVDPYSHVEISRAIHRILADSQFAEDLGNAGKLRVLENFTWKRSVSKLLSVLAPIAGERP